MKSSATSQPTCMVGCDVAEDFSNLNRCPSWGALSNYLKILRQFNLATLLATFFATYGENGKLYLKTQIYILEVQY